MILSARSDMNSKSASCSACVDTVVDAPLSSAHGALCSTTKHCGKGLAPKGVHFVGGDTL
jgi:hypothetical protein